MITDLTRKFLLETFFFQAEDGIRDGRVTGVQTCALPICRMLDRELALGRQLGGDQLDLVVGKGLRDRHGLRSEERRVGKEGRCWWAPCHEKKKIALIHGAT